jgi:pimeloyl-ACP methyl ester carboxylesterase
MATWTTPDESIIHFELYSSAPTFEEGAHQETLLLLPGLLGTIQTQWRNMLPPLMRRFRLVLVDLRGHGRSTNKETWLEPELIIADLLGVLNFLQVRHFHVAGYSLGGYLGLLLALAAPERVRSVLAHATKVYWSDQAVREMREQLDPDRLTEQAATYATQLADQHGAGRWRSLARQSADLVAYLAENGLTDADLRAIRCPVLVSVGDQDALVSLPEAARVRHLIPNAGLLVLPFTRHPFATLDPVPLVPVMEQFHRPPAR